METEIRLPFRDVSQEFLSLDSFAFDDFLLTVENITELSITIDWSGEAQAKQLKAFLEDPYKPTGQKRTAKIRATETQKALAPNVFASAVQWEKVEEK